MRLIAGKIWILAAALLILAACGGGGGGGGAAPPIGPPTPPPTSARNIRAAASIQVLPAIKRISLLPSKERSQLSRTADWFTNVSMQSTYTRNLSINARNIDMSGTIRRYNRHIPQTCRKIGILSTRLGHLSMTSTRRRNMSINLRFVDTSAVPVDGFDVLTEYRGFS